MERAERAFIVWAEDQGNKGGWDKNGERGREGGEDDTFMTSAAAFTTSSGAVVVQQSVNFT